MSTGITRYGETFAFVPRTKGIADITVNTSPVFETKVVFQTKDAYAASASGSLAAADAANRPISVTYEKDGSGKEVRVVTVCIGEAAKVDAQGLRKHANAAVNHLRTLKVAEADFVLPAVDDIPTNVVAEVVGQSVLLSNYHFDRYLTEADKKPTLLTKVNFVDSTGDNNVSQAIKETTAFAEGTIFARDLANERADEMTPGKLESIARSLAAETGAELHVVSGTDLLDKGLHLLYNVGQAAGMAREEHQPRYIELNYKGDPSNPDDVILVVGKGITYDTGGLNIKGTGFMEDMHMDMGGAAGVLGALVATHRLGIKRNVVFVATVAENAVDANSYKPKCIVRSYKGITIEVGNTDAEGRLALADALSYGQERNKPHTVLDMATLTGACVIALGEYAAGLFGNNESLKNGLVAAGKTKDERLWPMPIFPEHKAELSASSQSDLQSIGAGRYGGACTAAAFLENFIGYKGADDKTVVPAWAHIDIAGPAMRSKATVPHYVTSGTGFGVQALANYFKSANAGAPASNVVSKY